MQQALPSRMTAEVAQMLRLAEQLAAQRHSPYVDVEHILLAILDDHSQNEPLSTLLAGLDRGYWRLKLANELGMVREDSLPVKGLAPHIKEMVGRAVAEAHSLGHNLLNSGHILLAIVLNPSPSLAAMVAEWNLSPERMRAQIRANSGGLDPAAGRVQVMIRDQSPRAKAARPRPSTGETMSRVAPGMWYVVAAVAGIYIYLALFNRPALVSFGLVFAAWIFSLTLHEYAHALVAYWGGDYTVKERGYLSFNPLLYAEPFGTFLLPMLILLIGGLGLPGGAVYIREDLLRSKGWRTAVSLAGPASNIALALILSLPFIFGIIDAPVWSFGEMSSDLEAALAFIIFLQVTAALFNLIPIPPLDGFNAIAPFLPPQLVQQARAWGMFFFFILFYAFLSTSIGREFFQNVFNLTDILQVPSDWIVAGLERFRFWN